MRSRHVALGGDDGVAVDIDDALALRAVRGHHRMVAVGGEEGHRAGAGRGHRRDDRVGGIEHRHAVGRDVLHDHALDHRQIFDRGDVVQAEVVARADVGDHRHLAAVEAPGLRAACRRARSRTRRHRRRGAAARCARSSGRCSRRCRCAGRRCRRRRCWSCRRAGRCAASRCAIRRTVVVLPLVPVTATTGMRPSSPSANMLADDRLADRRGPCRRRARGACAGPGAALTSTTPPPCSSSGRSTLSQTTSTPQMSQADHLRRRHGARRHFRVHVVGDVGGGAAGAQVGVVAQHHALALRRHRVGAAGPAWPGAPGRCRRSGSWSARWRGRRRGAGRC